RMADCGRARHRDYHNCGHTALADREAVDWTVTGRRSRPPAVPCRADSWLVDEAPRFFLQNAHTPSVSPSTPHLMRAIVPRRQCLVVGAPSATQIFVRAWPGTRGTTINQKKRGHQSRNRDDGVSIVVRLILVGAKSEQDCSSRQGSLFGLVIPIWQ